MKIFIKKLNCHGTNRMVLEELKKNGLAYSSYEFGKIELIGVPTPEQWSDITKNLLKFGLQINQEENTFVAQIRQAVNEVIEQRDIPGNNLPLYLSEKFRNNFDYMNNFFREETGFSIEELYIGNSIEKRKRKRSMIEKYRRLFRLASDNETSEYIDTQYLRES